ncbi:UNVERIFIED_CONTAM: hypothetical protein HDU68_000920, partial [Siphonaria sp. JEL0065]
MSQETNPTDPTEAQEQESVAGSVESLHISVTPLSCLVGERIDKKLYHKLEELIVKPVILEAFEKAKKDEKIDQTVKEKIQHVYEAINKDNAATDIMSRLQEEKVKDSFNALVDYVKGLDGSSSDADVVSTDPTLLAVSGFLSAVFKDIAPLITLKKELTANITAFSKEISDTTRNIIDLHLENEIRDDKTLMAVVSSLNPLIESIVDFLMFSLDYYKNGHKPWKFPKNTLRKKEFDDIKSAFDTASKNLDKTTIASLLKTTTLIYQKLDRIEGNQLNKVGAEAPFTHDYPLRIGVLQYIDEHQHEFWINEDCRVENLIGKIAEEKKISVKEILLFHCVNFHPANISKRIKLSDKTPLKPKLEMVAQPWDHPIFDYAKFVEVLIREEGSKQAPIKLRLTEFKMEALRPEIEVYFDILKGTCYKIFGVNPNDFARTLLRHDDELKEFACKAYDFHIQRIQPEEGTGDTADQPAVDPEITERLPATYVENDTPSIITDSKPTFSAWLNPIDFSEDMESYFSQFVEGTRIRTLDLVWRWLRDPGESKIMWLYGGAGTGKSLISYAIIKKVPGEFILGSYFFCRHNDSQKSDPKSVVKSVVWDLVQNFGTLLPEFKRHVEKQWELDQSHMNDNSSLLLDPFRAFEVLVVGGLKEHQLDKTVLIVIDALDECNFATRASLLKILTVLSLRLPSFIKIFVTARPEADIFDCLKNLHPFELEPLHEDNLDDVELVVESRLRHLWKITGDLPTEVEACIMKLTEKSEGLFIYVDLVFKFLKESNVSFSDAQDLIANFSSGPDEVYTVVAKKALEVMGPEIFVPVLGCILFAQEPLDIPTLHFMASLSDQASRGFFEKLRCIRGINDGVLSSPEWIVDQLRSILKISNNRVFIIHKSVKDFFTSTQRSNQYFIHPDNVQMLLASGCIASILTILEHWKEKSVRDVVDSLARKQSRISVGTINGSSAVADYSVRHWADHLDALPSLPSSITDLTCHKRAIALTSAMVMNKEDLFVKLSDLDSDHNPVSLKAFLDLKYFTSPPLYEASKRGLALVCKKLLKSTLVAVDSVGYSPSPRSGESNKSPLMAAAKIKSLETVKVLLDFDADIFLVDGFGSTTLDHSSGDVFLFLQHQLRKIEMIKIQETMVRTSIFWRELFLSIFQSPIQKAICKRDAFAVKILLDESSDPVVVLSYQNPADGSNALHYAAEYFNETIFERLVAILKSVDSRNSANWTPLHYGAQNQHVGAVKLLLANDTRCNVENNSKQTPLHLSAQNGNIEVTKLLLCNGANVNAEDSTKRTPLHFAARNGHVNVARLLLQKGAKSSTMWTPLHLASQYGHADLVELLLTYGAAVNATNPTMATPLHLAALDGHVDIVQILLQKGASVHAVDSFGCVPLHLASQNGHVEAARLLLSYNAVIDAIDADERTPLHHAAQNGHSEAMWLLIDNGANVNAADCSNLTPLHFATQNGQSHAESLLLDKGAVLDTRIGAYINKKPFRHFEGKFVQRVFQEALNKAKNDDTVGKEKFKRISHVINEDNASIYIFSKLHDPDVKESFDAVMEYVNNLQTMSTSSQAVPLSDDPAFDAISGFLTATFHDLVPLVPFRELIIAVEKLGYTVTSKKNDLGKEVQRFSNMIKKATQIIKLSLESQTADEDTRTNVILNINTLIEAVINFFDFYFNNFVQNASKLKLTLRGLNVLSTLYLKKELADIEQRFETAHATLINTMQMLCGISIGNSKAGIQSDVLEMKLEMKLDEMAQNIGRVAGFE